MTRFVRQAVRHSLILVTLASCACASWVKEPEVRWVQVGIADIGLSGGTARVVLQVYNPNGMGLDARALEYRLSYLPADADVVEGTAVPEGSWRPLASGATAEPVRLPARDSARVTVDVPFEYRALGEALRGLLQEGGLRYRLAGAFTVGTPVGDRRVPFDATGFLRP